jgi:hypothetical protein
MQNLGVTITAYSRPGTLVLTARARDEQTYCRHWLTLSLSNSTFLEPLQGRRPPTMATARDGGASAANAVPGWEVAFCPGSCPAKPRPGQDVRRSLPSHADTLFLFRYMPDLGPIGPCSRITVPLAGRRESAIVLVVASPIVTSVR